MKLLSCQIVNFGCLSDLSFSFDEGLNLLYAPNGQGKSTFTVFLKAMLYGLPANTKRDITENERRRYAPWGGGTFGGSLCFEADGVPYRIERFFGAKEKDDRFALYNLATGMPSTRFSSDVGGDLLGIDADGFERSLYVSQRAPFLPPDNNSIRARLGSLLDASDDLGSFEQADRLLDDARRHYQLAGNRGRIADLALEIRDKEDRIRESEQAAAIAEAMAKECAEIEAKRAQVMTALSQARESRAQAEKRKLLEEQSNNYRILLENRESEKAKLAPVDAFFATHMPTEEELDEAELWLTECTTLSVQTENATLAPEDMRELNRFRESYGMKLPDAAITEQVRDVLAELREAKLKLSAYHYRTDEEKERLFGIFSPAPPTDEQEEAVRNATEALEEADARLYQTRAEKPKRAKILFTLFPILAVLSLIGAAIGFFLPLLPLAIPSVLCFIVFLGLFLLRFHENPGAEKRLLSELKEKKEALAALLSVYGYEDKNPLLSASRFFDDLEKFRRLREQETARVASYTAAKAEVSALSEQLLSLLTALGLHESDPEVGAARLDADIPAFSRLLSKESDILTTRARLEKQYTACHERLSGFLSHFPLPEGSSHRAALDAVKANLLLSRQTLIRYQEARDKLDAYLAATDFSPDAPLPPYRGEISVLLEEEKTLQKALSELERLLATKAAEEKRQAEIAAHRDMFVGERDALAKEKEACEHTLSLILAAKQFLSDAKEDLTTRYLRDMELYFDRYYKKIKDGVHEELTNDGTRASGFSFDTSLSLSTDTYGERRPLAVLSRGERDLLSFCARLSLIEAIYTAQTPFLVLDDPFVNLDDENYRKACALLSYLCERFQIIYTVCSTARLPADQPLRTLKTQP